MEKIEPYSAPVMYKNRSFKGDFVCGCGDEIDQEFMSVHLNDCDVMQDQYGDVFHALNVLIEDSPFSGTLNNIQAISTFFKNKLQRVISQDTMPAKDDEGDIIMDPDNIEENGNVGHEEDGLFMSCTKCLKKFDDFDMSQLVFLESCSHILCKGCFEQIVRRGYIKNQMAQCTK